MRRNPKNHPRMHAGGGERLSLWQQRYKLAHTNPKNKETAHYSRIACLVRDCKDAISML